MTYTGSVRVGGPPAVRELPRLVVTKVAVGPMDNNAYVLRCRTTGEQLLIDAAAEPDVLLAIAPRLAAVVTTHSHHDHWGALAAVLEATGARSLAHPVDAPDIEPEPDEPLRHGDRIRWGDVELSVIHLRGHTPGSVALLYDDPDGPPHLFTGDSLFPGGPGNTDRDPRRFALLIGDLELRIFAALPDETWVYPGHGRDTTLGAERPNLPGWRERGW